MGGAYKNCDAAWRRLAPAGLAAVLLVAVWPSAQAQLSASAQSNGKAVLIEAEEGIEWRRNDQVYEANGNAVATRGQITVHAATLRAFYRENTDGKTNIFKLEAVGSVVIASPDMEARGDRAVYDIDTGSLTLFGRDVQLETEDYTVFANGNLEYHERGNYAVATDGAKAVSGDRELRADALYAYFRQGDGATENGQQQLERLVADGNMVIVTPTEVVQAQRGTYFPETEIAMAEGDVQISRGDSHLVGEVAEVNLVTGVSRIMAGRPGESRRPRVIGVFTPDSIEQGN